jgi:hypothetical protein
MNIQAASQHTLAFELPQAHLFLTFFLSGEIKERLAFVSSVSQTKRVVKSIFGSGLSSLRGSCPG